MLDANLKNASLDEALDRASLRRESDKYRGTSGVSEECRGSGFSPAFYDRETGEIHLSRYADGTPAPFHMLDGLPDAVVTKRLADGTVECVKQSLQSGFVKSGVFYTRDQAISSLTDERAE